MLLQSIYRLAGLVLASISCVAYSAQQDHAVVFVYHHVSTETPASTSVTPRQFEAHMAFLERNQFTVWPLGKIVHALATGQTVPDNTVAITFDDAGVSVYEEVLPNLQVRGWPFTLFVSTESVERGYGASLSWDQVRRIAAAGNEIGNHSHTHKHLIRRENDEDTTTWKNRVHDDIQRAQSIIEANTGQRPTLFSYPYGEYTDELQSVVAELDLYGIAQQSGAIGQQSDFLALPRFPMATQHASLSRLATAARSMPLPVTEVELSAENDFSGAPEWITLTLGTGNYQLNQLACYRASGAQLEIGRLPGEKLQILIDLKNQSQAGRNKINCTAPSIDEQRVFYWYSHLWIQKRTDGSWYRE